MATLLITKKPSDEYSFILNGDSQTEIINLRTDLTVVGGKCHFKTSNGANLIKEQNIMFSDVTLVASGTFTFVSVFGLFAKLKEIGFFDWINGLGVGGTTKFSELDDTFGYFGKAGQAVVVSDDELSLDTISIYNYRKFVDLEDTFDAIVPNKMLATNSTGTGIILKDLPENQVTNLPFYNKITAKTGFTLVGLDLTINPLWAWTLQGIDYTNTDSQIKTFVLSQAGLSRFVYVIPNSNNGFDVIEGQESVTPIAPQIPYEGVYVTYLLITDTLATDNGEPDLSDYATINYSDAQDLLKVDKVDGERLINASEIVKLGNQSGVNTGDQDLSGYYNKTEVDNKLVSVYIFKGSVANFASLPSTGLTAGDVYDTADTGANYAWNGSAWDILGISVDISGKVDKVAGERLINASEITKLGNQSGTNTGDETLATIKTKLGVTTLSGSNTGDQDLSNYTTNANLSQTLTHEATWLMGNSKVFTLPNAYFAVYAVYLNGQKMNANEYSFTSSTQVTVIPTLFNGDTIGFLYGTNASANNAPYYLQAQIDEKFSVQGLDIAGKENAFNKQNSLAIDGTGSKYPTVDAVSEALVLKEDKANKSQTIEIDKASTSKYGSVKAFYDWAVAKFQLALVSGTNIRTINGTSVLGSGDIVVSGGGGGDMTTTTAQTVSGVKTFLNGMFGFRNVANTFTSFFTNANTASRTYTLQNRNGTLADDTDLAGKMANPIGGIANYLPKFLTANTLGLSKLFELNGYFGLDTVYSPSKNLSLGNQTDKEIGIEESTAIVAGKNLTLSAGRTNNYIVENSFSPLNTGLSFISVAMAPNGDMYAIQAGGIIVKRLFGQTNFVALSGATTMFEEIFVAFDGTVYATDASTSAQNGLYIKSNIDNTFTRPFYHYQARGGTIAPNGDIYSCGNINLNGGGIQIKTFSNGVVSEVPNTAGIGFRAMTCTLNGDIYAVAYLGDIYKRTNGVGNFVPLGQTYRLWYGIAFSRNGNIYATTTGGDVYVQYQGAGAFVPLNQEVSNWGTIAADADNNIYVVRGSYYATSQPVTGDIYFLSSSNKGLPDLAGGTLKVKAGTGKGTGKSRYEIWTGQKTTSGTDMQIETLREYVDENGYHIYISMPVYADNAAATTAGLPVGCKYRTSTGLLMIRY